MCVKLPEYIGNAYRKKLSGVIETVTRHLPEQPEEAYVSTDLDEGVVVYPGVWLFTPRLLVEIRNPLYGDRIQFEIARLERAVDWVRLNARKYEFDEPTDNSQLELEFTTIDGLSSALLATGRGCRELMNVYHTRFLPNLVSIADEVGQSEEHLGSANHSADDLRVGVPPE